jgi:ATPase subunit of ABC transporter with duplicated ATPase domains
MSETPRDPNEPRDTSDEWLPDDPATEEVARPSAPTTPPARSETPEFDQGAIERERNRKAQADADAGIAVKNEPPPAEAEEEEYRWHTGMQRPTGQPDAVEFVDVHKAFGRNKILRGLNMGIPEGMISMILGPSGTGKSVCIKHMVGLLYPTRATSSSTASPCRTCRTTSCSRCARSSASSSRTARCSAR